MGLLTDQLRRGRGEAGANQLGGLVGDGGTAIVAVNPGVTMEGQQRADIVLIGSDRISAAGSVLNKTGSFPAVISARHVGNAKVVVLVETEKAASPGEKAEHAAEEN